MFVSKGSARSLVKDEPQEAFMLRPFASLGLNMFNNQPKAESIKDKRSGIVFPGEFCLTGTSGCPRITGTGVRTKKIAGIKSLDIYALALYVDEPAIKRVLHSKFGSSTADALVKNPALFDGKQPLNTATG